MKYSTAFERDYEFYTKSMNYFSFSGKPLIDIKYESNGVRAKQCVRLYDSHGKLFPCNEPELAAKILNCKASVNLHIKMYAESLARGEFQLIEIIEIFEPYNPPDWVINAVKKQAYKHGWLSKEWEQDRARVVRVAIVGRREITT